MTKDKITQHVGKINAALAGLDQDEQANALAHAIGDYAVRFPNPKAPTLPVQTISFRAMLHVSAVKAADTIKDAYAKQGVR